MRVCSRTNGRACLRRAYNASFYGPGDIIMSHASAKMGRKVARAHCARRYAKRFFLTADQSRNSYFRSAPLLCSFLRASWCCGAARWARRFVFTNEGKCDLLCCGSIFRAEIQCLLTLLTMWFFILWCTYFAPVYKLFEEDQGVTTRSDKYTYPLSSNVRRFDFYHRVGWTST